jgi:hypothetical protein
MTIIADMAKPIAHGSVDLPSRLRDYDRDASLAEMVALFKPHRGG